MQLIVNTWVINTSTYEVLLLYELASFSSFIGPTPPIRTEGFLRGPPRVGEPRLSQSRCISTSGDHRPHLGPILGHVPFSSLTHFQTTHHTPRYDLQSELVSCQPATICLPNDLGSNSTIFPSWVSQVDHTFGLDHMNSSGSSTIGLTRRACLLSQWLEQQ